MWTQTVEYAEGETTCEGFAAVRRGGPPRVPAVLVFHAWGGAGPVERARAESLARLGYLGFAADVYGRGRRGGVHDDNSALMMPFVQDRALLRRRLTAAVAAVAAHPRVDPERIAAVGYCFGGLCALDVARANLPGVRAVVSFHGVLHPPELGPQAPIGAQVLVLHGYDDPLARPAQLVALADELTAARATWEVHAYGQTHHAFTFEGAAHPDRGNVYNARSARRAWNSAVEFLAEALA
jgi:dienelactone hydrolase